MKILIFEGIATSGKSTITDQLVKTLKDELNIELATEEQTHEPIMNQRSDLNIHFFQDLINKLTVKRPDLLVFDRLYITQAYRAKVSLSEYTPIENALMLYSPHTIILKVDEGAIADRVKVASEHRELEWREYLKTKGDSFEEIASDYIDQQKGVLNLVKQSQIPYMVFDTTHHNYESITEEILKIVRS